MQRLNLKTKYTVLEDHKSEDKSRSESWNGFLREKSKNLFLFHPKSRFEGFKGWWQIPESRCVADMPITPCRTRSESLPRQQCYSGHLSPLHRVRTPGGRLIAQYLTKTSNTPRCGDCGCQLQGVRQISSSVFPLMSISSDPCPAPKGVPYSVQA